MCFLEVGGIGPSFEYVTITWSLDSPKLKIFVFIQVHECFLYMYAVLGMCMHVCRGWKLTLGAISQCLACFETVSLTGPWNFQIVYGSLVSELKDFLPSSFQCWNYKCASPYLDFDIVARDQTHILKLAWQVVYIMNHLPNIRFKKNIPLVTSGSILASCLERLPCSIPLFQSPLVYS